MSTVRLLLPLLLVLLPAASGGSALAQHRGFGLGIVIGEPTGFAAKAWIDGRSAVAGALAWSFVHETTFHVHADYILHTTGLTDRADVPAYYGLGGRIKTSGRGGDRVGFRVVGGIAYHVPRAPVDLFLEFAPVLDFAPSTDLEFTAGFGARYYFP